jgi:hypothetical protein
MIENMKTFAKINKKHYQVFICMKLNQNSIAKVCTTNSGRDKIYL